MFVIAEEIWNDFRVLVLVKARWFFLLIEQIMFLEVIPVFTSYMVQIKKKHVKFEVKSNNVSSLSAAYWISNVEQII